MAGLVELAVKVAELPEQMVVAVGERVTVAVPTVTVTWCTMVLQSVVETVTWYVVVLPGATVRFAVEESGVPGAAVVAHW